MIGPAASRLLAGVALASGLLAGGCGASKPDRNARQAADAGTGSTTTQESTSKPSSQSSGSQQSSQSSSQSSTQSGDGNVIDQSSQQNSRGGSSNQSSIQRSNGNGKDEQVSSFSGRGPSTLTFNVQRGARFSWTNTAGRPFVVTSSSPRLSINSRAGLGELDLPAGTYRDVRIRQAAAWTAVVRSR